MTEYLRGFRTGRIEGIRTPDLMGRHQIISPSVLKAELDDAFIHLVTTPGPHREDRRLHAPSWIPWWTGYLTTLPDAGGPLEDSAKVVPFEEIAPRLDPAQSSGLLFAAGAEGHEGHRFAAWWMRRHVDQTVLMLEEEEYLEDKARGGSYLPLEVRLSLWAHHPHIDLVSVIPLRDKVKFPDVNQYYQDIFNRTGAQYCFATEDDPWEEAKRNRGKQAGFTRIPAIRTPSTTDRVMKFMEDADEEGGLQRESFLPFEPDDPYEQFSRFDGRFS